MADTRKFTAEDGKFLADKIIKNMDDITALQNEKQDNLTAGDGISIAKDSESGKLIISYVKEENENTNISVQELFLIPIEETTLTKSDIQTDGTLERTLTTPYTFEEVLEEHNAKKIVAIELSNTETNNEGMIIPLTFHNVDGEWGTGSQAYGYDAYVDYDEELNKKYMIMEMSIVKQISATKVYQRKYEIITSSGESVDNSYIDTAIQNVLTNYNTKTEMSEIIESINEKILNHDSEIENIQFKVDGLGEPFRIKQWQNSTLNITIPTVTSEMVNTNIPKLVYSIDDVEGTDYQIVGMTSYEIFDAASGGNRINCFPVCQFTGNGQKELSVRFMCGGTSNKTAKRINAWVLLKHR